jgi:hypothetical protein
MSRTIRRTAASSSTSRMVSLPWPAQWFAGGATGNSAGTAGK